MSLQLHSPTVTLLVVCSFSLWIPVAAFQQKPPSWHSPQPSSTRTISTILLASNKDWDAILRDDDEDENENKRFIPNDMKYTLRNCQRQQKTLHAIRDNASPDLIHDVYVQQPDTDTFWYMGKVARVSSVSVSQAICRQWNIIEAHAANLRPLELYPAHTQHNMQIWVAPGDSEMDVAYNRPHVLFERIERTPDMDDKDHELWKIRNHMVGFQGEVYELGEEGFRTWRKPDGTPARPELQGPDNNVAEHDGQESEYRAPNEEEMEKIKKALEGKDINAIYEEQERRKREKN